MATTTLSVPARSRLGAVSTTKPASHTMSESAESRPLTRELVLEKYDAEFPGTTLDLRRGTRLADRIAALDEPWRSRFVELVARRKGADAHGPITMPSQTQLTIWLADQSLGRMVRQMLRVWMHET